MSHKFSWYSYSDVVYVQRKPSRAFNNNLRIIAFYINRFGVENIVFKMSIIKES